MKTSTGVMVALLFLGLASNPHSRPAFSAELVIDFYADASRSEPPAAQLVVSFFDPEEIEEVEEVEEPESDVRLTRIFTPAAQPPGVRRTRIFTPAVQPLGDRPLAERPTTTYQVTELKRLGWRIREARERRVERRRQ